MSSQSAPRTISRRRFVSASLSAGGAGLALGDLLRLQSLGAEQSQVVPDTSVIQIWLGGGPSQFETFDPKPLAPIEIRGPYRAIASKLPGALMCEMMPLTAGVLDKTAIIKSFTHPYDDHFGVMRWCLEGRKEPDKREGYPSVGSIASRFRGPRQVGMPPYVMLTEEPVMHHHLFDAMGPGYLGVSHSPFAVLQDPYPFEFQYDRLRSATSSLELANDSTLDRINDRKSLLAELDRLPRRLESGARGPRSVREARSGLDHQREGPPSVRSQPRIGRDARAIWISSLGTDGALGTPAGGIGSHLRDAEYRSRLLALGLARQHHA
jgi:hypothetical protein